jgi:hypothetical protein
MLRGPSQPRLEFGQPCGWETANHPAEDRDWTGAVQAGMGTGGEGALGGADPLKPFSLSQSRPVFKIGKRM